MIAPNTNIRLLKTPMELDEANTLSFVSETAKYNYFNSLPKLELEDATYQRKDGVIRYPTSSSVTFEDLLEYNYCMYQNESYDTKWFYAFVNSVTYINDGMCEIKIETDTFMTWQNDIVYKQSFVEREHVSDDTIGKHTIPENVETGEFLCNATDNIGYGSCHAVIMCAWNPVARNDGEGHFEGRMSGGFFQGIYQGCDYFLMKDDTTISEFLGLLSVQSKLESVIGVYMVPDQLSGYASIEWDYLQPGLLQYYGYKRLTAQIVGQYAKFIKTKSVTKNLNQLDQYVPKNNKLFTAQFNYLMASNSSGGNVIYYYEDFSTADCQFDSYGVISPGCSIKAYPKYYKYLLDNYEFSINVGKYPIGSFTGDMYTNWLTQNSVNVSVGNYDVTIKPGDIGMLTGGLAVAGGVGLLATGGGALAGTGAILSGASQIASSIGEVQKHQKQPPFFGGNTNVGDITYAMGLTDIIFYKMCIKKEYAKIIDDYFTMYGYKVNALETINIHKRTYFDYIKTIGCNIIGNIPQVDLQHIKKLFDNGITIWHNPTYFLDYSVNNTIVS